MKLSAVCPARWLFGLASLLAACHPTSPDHSLPDVPLLEAVPAGYRSVNQQDTLYSDWAPPAARTSPSFDFTSAHRSAVLLQVRLIPASVARRPEFDTLTFYAMRSGHGMNRDGLSWIFDLGVRHLQSTLRDARGEPAKVFSALYYPLVVTEERVSATGYIYVRNRYTIEYPFCPVAVARRSDSLVYVRAYLVQANVPQADTLYQDSDKTPPRRLPHEADRLDTTRQALLCFRLRQLRHSVTPSGY
jgi:hypothetical protein